MDETRNGTRVILIGGTSNVGKSTLAQALAFQLGWDYQSTDKLARHPGFPWVGVDGLPRPANVIEHYRTLDVAELLVDVLAHYQKNVVPQVESLVWKCLTGKDGVGLVIEGSALWPDFVVGLLQQDGVKALWLTGSDSLFERRIYQRSHFAQTDEQEKYLIQKFLDRTLLYNRRMVEETERLGLVCLDVESFSPDALLEMSLNLLRN